jgi:lysophospholipase L1-like esterase
MIGKAGMLGCAVCVLVGVGVGICLALVRPELLRRMEKKLGKDSRQLWLYSQNVAFHRRVDACVPDGSVLFIGDSFIQGMNVTGVTKDGINFGIGGDTTKGVLARLPMYRSLAKARAVVIAVGDNDLRRGSSEAEVAGNYKKIIAQMPKTVPIFFCSLVPCVEEPDFADINRGIASLNRSLKELCDSDSRCHLVNLGPRFNTEQGALRREFADEDGVHLNGSGYRVCIEKLREALQPVLSAPANTGA